MLNAEQLCSMGTASGCLKAESNSRSCVVLSWWSIQSTPRTLKTKATTSFVRNVAFSWLKHRHEIYIQKNPNIFHHRPLMTVTGKMFKAGLALRCRLLLGHCTCGVCDACCPRSPSSTQTTSHSEGSALQSSSAPLPLLSSPDFLRSPLELRSGYTHAQFGSTALPQHLHFGLWVSMGRQASCRATEGICSFQLCSFLEINFSNTRRKENGIVYKMTDF